MLLMRAAAVVLACALLVPLPAFELTRFEFQQPHMGTTVRIVLYAGDGGRRRSARCGGIFADSRARGSLERLPRGERAACALPRGRRTGGRRQRGSLHRAQRRTRVHVADPRRVRRHHRTGVEGVAPRARHRRAARCGAPCRGSAARRRQKDATLTPSRRTVRLAEPRHAAGSRRESRRGSRPTRRSRCSPRAAHDRRSSRLAVTSPPVTRRPELRAGRSGCTARPWPRRFAAAGAAAARGHLLLRRCRAISRCRRGALLPHRQSDHRERRDGQARSDGHRAERDDR